MARRRLPARLWLRSSRADRRALWVILDGEKEIGTGVGEDDLEGAQAALEHYLAQRYKPPSGITDPGRLLVDEVMAAYLSGHAPDSPSRDWLVHTSEPILQWWSGKPLSLINVANCKSYVNWRTAQRIKSYKKRPGKLVSDQTARHELKTLRAAINFYHKAHGPLAAVPTVTVPPKATARPDYYWTRSEAAARLRAARSRPRLALHARRWRDADLRRGIASVIHYDGAPLRSRVRRSWETVRKLAGHPRADSPHVLRHTAATWFMQSGVDIAEVSGYLGMSIETLRQVYWHHHPDFQAAVAQATPGKRINRGGSR